MSASSEISSFIQNVPQIVPESWCLKCKICCRFPDSTGVQTPTWSALEANWDKIKNKGWLKPSGSSPTLVPVLKKCSGSAYCCPAFQMDSNTCSIYHQRPLDCRLYPFVITKDTSHTRTVLAMDMKCPYLQEHGGDSKTIEYAQQLARYLDSQTGAEYCAMNPEIIGPHWPEFITVAALPHLTLSTREKSSHPHPALWSLEPTDLSKLIEALVLFPHESSHYTAAAIFGWADLIQFWQTMMDGALCLFARQAGGFFMPLPPLGKEVSEETLNKCWMILDELNHGTAVSRIENVDEKEAQQFLKAGFQLTPSEQEYIYRRESLVRLSGNQYKSQRNAVNKFKRHTVHTVRDFRLDDLTGCLQLYTQWAIQHQKKSEEFFEKALIRDGLFFHRRLMMSHQELRLQGKVVEINGKISGYTFGAEISKKMFGIFLEITDHAFPGISNFLFQEFCRDCAHELVNTMGDASFPGLRQSKRGYRPVSLISTLTAQKTTSRPS